MPQRGPHHHAAPVRRQLVKEIASLLPFQLAVGEGNARHPHNPRALTGGAESDSDAVPSSRILHSQFHAVSISHFSRIERLPDRVSPGTLAENVPESGVKLRVVGSRL